MWKTSEVWCLAAAAMLLAPTAGAQEPGQGTVEGWNAAMRHSPRTEASYVVPEPLNLPTEAAETPAVAEEHVAETTTIHEEHAPQHVGGCVGQQDGCCHGHACGRRRPTLQDRWHSHIKPCLQATHWGYPEYFEERPFGTLVCRHMGTQIANGRADRLVLYHYDFGDGILQDPSELNAHGDWRLCRMAAALQDDVCPIVIECTPGGAELDAARRSHVLAALRNRGLDVPEESVVVGTPPARGMSGDEAYEIYQGLLMRTRAGGHRFQGMSTFSYGYGYESGGFGSSSSASSTSRNGE